MNCKQRINNYINTHKYVIVVTTIAVVAVIMLRNQDSVQWVNNKPSSDEIFGFISAK